MVCFNFFLSHFLWFLICRVIICYRNTTSQSICPRLSSKVWLVLFGDSCELYEMYCAIFSENNSSIPTFDKAFYVFSTSTTSFFFQDTLYNVTCWRHSMHPPTPNNNHPFVVQFQTIWWCLLLLCVSSYFCFLHTPGDSWHLDILLMLENYSDWKVRKL